MNISLGQSILIVDEAHNLPDRIRMSMERVLTPAIVRNTEFELQEYVETLTETYQKTTSTLTAIELDVATWAWEIMKIARTKMEDLFRQLRSDLIGNDEESFVEVDRLTDIFHRSCDEYEGLSGQKTLNQEPNNP